MAAVAIAAGGLTHSAVAESFSMWTRAALVALAAGISAYLIALIAPDDFSDGDRRP